MIGHNYVQLDYASDSGEDDDWWNDRNYIQSGVKVEVSIELRKCVLKIFECHKNITFKMVNFELQNQII